MKPVEQIIVGIERYPWSAIYRGVVGFAIPPVFRAIGGNGDAIWITLSLFVVTLITLRGVPAVLRHILPFSVEAKDIWSARRKLSKESDAYAWHKLLWIGLGLLLYATAVDELRSGEHLIMYFCLIGGGAGFLIWRLGRAAKTAQ